METLSNKAAPGSGHQHRRQLPPNIMIILSDALHLVADMVRAAAGAQDCLPR